MGGVYGKKKRYSIDHEPPGAPGVRNGTSGRSRELGSDRVLVGPSPRPSSSQTGDQEDELIKPRKLLNPVRESRSHQEVQRELMHTCRSVEVKPELQRVLESRRRDQLIRRRRQEEEAHRQRSPLEAELLRRHRKLEEVEQQEEQQEELPPPEFIRVKENLRRTSFQNEEKEVSNRKSSSRVTDWLQLLRRRC